MTAMTDDLLTALAREYAEECIDPQGFSKSTYEELVDEKAENVAYVLRWLCDRYYLVKKSKVEELEVVVEPKHYDRVTLLEQIKSLFPEIAKEVEG